MADDDVIRQFGGHLPSIFSNYFHVAVSQEISKIVFGEAYGDQASAHFHTSIAMTPADAERLANLILQLLAQNRQESAKPPTGRQ